MSKPRSSPSKTSGSVSPEALGQTIKRLRTDKGYTSLRQFAPVAHISYPYLAQIERGEKWPSRTMLVDISKALDIDEVDLLASARLVGTETFLSEDVDGGLLYGSASAQPGLNLLDATPRGRTWFSSTSAFSASDALSDAASPAAFAAPTPARAMLMRSASITPSVASAPSAVPAPVPAISAYVQELQEICAQLSPEDRRTVLDLARRLRR